MVGNKYGKLTVIETSHYVRGHRHVRCRCDCGNDIVVDAQNLTRGMVGSCGCIERGGGRGAKDYTSWTVRKKLPVNNMQRRQLLIQERGALCEVCGFDCEYALQVHHIYPVTNGGLNTRSNLVVMCANCHSITEAVARGKCFRDDVPSYSDEEFELIVAYSGRDSEPVKVPSRLSETISRLAT